MQMRRLCHLAILLACAALLFCAPPLARAAVTDACTEATGATLPNPPWTNIQGSMAYNASGFCYDGSGNAYSIYTGTSFTAAQYSQAELTISSGAGVAVRMDSSGDGYIWWPGVTGTTIFKISAFGGAGGITMSTACPSVSTGDTIKLSVDSAYNFTCTDITTSASGAGTDGSSYRNSGSPGFETQVGAPIINFQADNVAAQAAAPTFSPTGPRLPTGGAAVTLSTSSSGCSGSIVWNTTNAQLGGNLTGTSSTNPLTVSTNETVYAQVQGCAGFTNSTISSQAFTVGNVTWYVQPNGGPRYDATYNPTGDSCNGQSVANMVVSGGPNQACAFNDYRYIWANGSAAGSMVGIGGDRYNIANTYPGGQTGWRVGRAGPNSGDLFNGYTGVGGGDPYTDYNPPFPAGTSGNPTIVAGSNYYLSGCLTRSQKTQLFGGYAVLAVLNMQAANYVTVACLEVTDHSSCIKHGTAGLPSVCSNSIPFTDYANSGIQTADPGDPYVYADQMQNVMLQDLDIHGFPHGGIAGAIGGSVSMTRVSSNFNGFAGWDFDFGSSGHGYPNNPASTISASYVTMDWNGCNEEYPISDPIPITYCYSITNNGFGDAWSGQDSNLASMTCSHCEMAQNVKDAFFGPHTAIGSVNISQSYAANNGGQTWKANLGQTGQWLMQNTLTDANCRRLAQAVTGAPSTFNTYISNGDLCRADGAAMAIVWPVSGSFEADNNTFVAASQNVTADFTCWNQFATVSVGSGGTGYQVGDVLYVGGTQATVTVTSVSSGVITGISLTLPGQVTNASVPFTETYIWGGHGTGAQITVDTVMPVSCGGGNRILRNNNFIGYTNPNNVSWNGQTIGMFCYSVCNGNPGTSTDAMWTTRSNNNFWSFKSGTFACTYAGETCTDPLMVVEPSQTWVSETQLDSFNAALSSSANSFYPLLDSPLVGAGVNFSGIPTTDYYGATRSNPPAIGAVEPAGTPTAATPTFSPNGGTSSSPIVVTIASSTSGATICYTEDGSTPTGNGAGTCTHGATLVNGGAVTVSSTIAALKAIATESGFNDSGVGTSSSYTINTSSGGVVFGGSMTISGSLTAN